MTRPWSAGCYGVARQRDGRAKTASGPRINLNYHPYARGGADDQASGSRRRIAAKDTYYLIAAQGNLSVMGSASPTALEARRTIYNASRSGAGPPRRNTRRSSEGVS